MGPVDFLRDRFDRVRTHPFQALAGGAMGMMFPGAGMLAGRGFDLYNNHQFNNSADQSYQHGADQGNQAQDDAMNRPLDGPLGQFDGMGSGGGSDNTPLAQALSGGGGQGGPGMGYNPGMNYGNNYGQGPSQYSPLSSLLDFLGPNPNQQGMQGEHRSHQEIMQDLQDQQGMGQPALYGISPGMVNGGMVINGMRPAGYDPNQGAMAHHFFGG